MMDFVVTVTHFLRLWVAFFNFHECQEMDSGPTEKDLDRGQKKREMDNFSWSYWRENWSTVQMRKNVWKQNLRKKHVIKSFVRSAFPFKRALTCNNLLFRIDGGELFGYVQCDIKVPDNLTEKVETSPPFFKHSGFSLGHW